MAEMLPDGNDSGVVDPPPGVVRLPLRSRPQDVVDRSVVMPICWEIQVQSGRTSVAILRIVKRTGDIVPFDRGRIHGAVTKAIRAAGAPVEASRIHAIVDGVVAEAEARFGEAPPTVEHVQDLVEKALVREGLYEVAKAYILYRADRQRERDAQRAAAVERARLGRLTVRTRDGATVPVRHGAARGRGHRAGRRSRARRLGRRAGRRGAPHDLRRHGDDADRAGAGARRGGVHRARSRLQRRGVAAAARRAVPRGDAGVARRRRSRRALPRRVRGRAAARHRQRPLRRPPGRVRPRGARRGAAAGARRAVAVPRRADARRSLPRPRRRPHGGAAAGVLDARRDGARRRRGRADRPGDRLLRPHVDAALRAVDADAVPRRHAAAAAVVLLSDHGAGRPRPHLQGARRQRPALEVVGRARQRLDQHPRHRRAHRQHPRREPGRGAVPQGRQRRDDGDQPQRQAPRRDLRLSRGLALRHRGLPRAAPQHRRRAPPHPRHEHGGVDPRPVHGPGRGRRAVDAVLAGRSARSARDLRPRLRRPLSRGGGARRARRAAPAPHRARRPRCGARC